jgi:large subunit ribosomal protein L15
MKLNTLTPAKGEKRARKRVGRGSGSNLGKTCGRGHKGQKSRSGGSTKIGFEGGQMPLQRRLPKVGFCSRVYKTRSEVRLSEIDKLKENEITIDLLKKYNLVSKNIKKVKVILSGEITREVTINKINVTKGAKKAIEALNGKIKE